MLLLLWSAFFGAVYAIVLPIYAILNIECPFDRVAFYLTLLACNILATVVGYLLLPSPIFLALSIFMLTKFMCWCIFNHENMVHYSLDTPED
jgi:hypothetical protein